MSTNHWCAIVALWSAPGTREGHGTAQSARTYRTRFKVGFCPQVSSVPQVLYLHVRTLVPGTTDTRAHHILPQRATDTFCAL